MGVVLYRIYILLYKHIVSCMGIWGSSQPHYGVSYSHGMHTSCVQHIEIGGKKGYGDRQRKHTIKRAL